MTAVQQDIRTITEKKYAWMSQIVSTCYNWKKGSGWNTSVLHNVVNSWKKDVRNPYIILYLSKIEDKIYSTMTSSERILYQEEMKYYIGCLLTDLLIFAHKVH